MLTMLTVIRKRAEVSTEEFRRFLEFDYGPTYGALPQVKEYEQYYLADLASAGAEDPIDAVVRIAFEDEATMREALASQEYRKAHLAREAYMRETSVGIHSGRVEKLVRFK
jgi:hypothetical protein